MRPATVTGRRGCVVGTNLRNALLSTWEARDACVALRLLGGGDGGRGDDDDGRFSVARAGLLSSGAGSGAGLGPGSGAGPPTRPLLLAATPSESSHTANLKDAIADS